MSGSETGGVVTNSSPFSIGFQKSPLVVSSEQQQPVVQNMHFAYAGGDGSSAFKPVSGGSAHFQSPAAAVPYDPNMMGQPAKKKRGRPRRYGPDGTMSLGLSPAGSGGSMSQSGGSFAPTSQSPGSLHSLKKGRGRPLGSSSKKQQLQALGSAGFGFLPHVITVNVGEDVSSKIMSLSQNGPRAVCVLSANGSISNVTLRQAATSGGTATYEGRFEILSLSGSFLLTEIGGQRSRTGGLSISLAGPDGRVLGGSVAGLLTAASPVQVIVGSFIADGGVQKKSKAMNEREPASAQANFGSIGGGGSTGGSSSPSHGTASESSGGGPVSPLQPMNNNNNTNQCNINSNPPPPPPQQQQPPFPMMPWR